MQGSTSIPANWGSLVSVNISPQYPDIVLLWFQDDAGSVRRMVGYHVGKNALINVTQIRSRQEEAGQCISRA